MTDDERLIDEVADSIDPMLRWLAVWHADGYPVEVDGNRAYMCVRASVLFPSPGLVVVQDVPDSPQPTHVVQQIQITLVKVTAVKIPAPEHIRERVSKIFG